MSCANGRGACGQQRADVSCSVVQPLKKETIEDIAEKLVQSKQSYNSVEFELTYRRALKEALVLLESALPSGDSPLKKKHPDQEDAQERAWLPPATTHKAPPDRAEEQEIGDTLPASKFATNPRSSLRTRVGSQSPCSSMEAAKRHESVDTSASPASECLTVAGPLAVPPSHKGCTVATTSRRKSLLATPKDGELSKEELGSIEEGMLVWCKTRGYPYWPSVVKKMKWKDRKAIVLFVEKGMENKSKGFSVCLRNLKHFDCKEKQAFIDEAQEDYKHEINWCIRSIEDYQIKVGCNSFTGSFLEYCSNPMAQSKRSRNSVESEVPSGADPLKKHPTQKDALERAWLPLAITQNTLPERVEEQEIRDALPSSELAAIKNEPILCSVESPHREAVCHGHVGNEGLEGQPCCGISKAKGLQLSLRTRVGSKSSCSSKKAIKQHEAVDASTCLASECLTVTSPPAVSPSCKSHARAMASRRKSLLASPKDTELSKEGEATPKGSDRVSNDNKNTLNGTLSQNHTTASSTSKKHHRLCLEDLDLEPLPKRPAFKGQGDESWIFNREPSKLLSADAGEGLESSSDLSLSPVRTRSFTRAISSEEEDEELPSFFLPQELGPIKEGKLVWCKTRGYPYWPAVVKKMKRKDRKAIVLFVMKGMENKGKGFSVCLRNLKHFDCKEKQAFIDEVQGDYKHEIKWCLNLIEDYRIRVGCNSFTGSFLEYCSNPMSFPVRNEGLPHRSLMNFLNVEEEDDQGTPSKATRPKRAKLLPDRTRAARDKANQKLVDFIVNAQGAEEHLQAILRQQKSSRWLAQFLPGQQHVKYIETYLEDDTQQDLVFHYLEGVYHRTGDKVLPGFCRDRVRFILDVLFPEAIIYAIAAVEKIEYQKAEEKYFKGPPVSQRERRIFEEKIWKQWRAQELQGKQAPTEDSP
ncbi:PWWP domain-containing DNA repair factor 3A isoform X2 [Anolis sagrei]|uniref:PWWP domain-containing DNA repair factor 3A isoform X2 n=1 Tax=Anolis sagrei TaxID=38937 RepID=UPI0035221AC6